MNDDIRRLMNSSHIEDRKQAIRRLAETKDPSALTFLSAIYRTDTDETVRELALKAGRYIKQNSSQLSALSTQEVMAAPLVASPYTAETVETAAAGPAASMSDEEARRQRAAALMASAKEHFDDRNRVEARQLAAEAFSLAPEFEKDVYYMELLGQIMEVRTEYALSELADYRRGGYERRKRKREFQSLDDTPAVRAVSYVVLIALVCLGGGAALFAAVGQAMQPELSLAATVVGNDPVRGTFLGGSTGIFIQLLNFSAQGVPANAWRGMVAGFNVFAALMVGYFIVSVAARSFFGGDGTFGGLLRATYRSLVACLVLLLVGYGVLSVLYLRPILNGLYASLSQNVAAPYENAIAASAPIGAALLALVVLVALLGVGLVGRGVARNYRLSAANGTSSVMIALVVIAFSGCGLLVMLTPLYARGGLLAGL